MCVVRVYAHFRSFPHFRPVALLLPPKSTSVFLSHSEIRSLNILLINSVPEKETARWKREGSLSYHGVPISTGARLYKDHTANKIEAERAV
jgi:hypothetical protein